MSQFFGKKVTFKSQGRSTFASARDTNVVAQADAASTWEQFRIYLIEAEEGHPSVVALRTWNKKYVSMRDGGENYGLTLVDSIDDWERFEIVKYQGKDAYTIRSVQWPKKFWKFDQTGVGIWGQDADATTDPTYYLTEISIVN